MRTLAFCAALALLAPVAAHADDASDFRDFRIPASRAVSWVGDMNGRVSWGHGDSRYSVGATHSLDLRLTQTHLLRLEDDHRTFRIDDAVSFSGTRYTEQGDSHDLPQLFGSVASWAHHEQMDKDTYDNARLRLEYDRYRDHTPMFVTVTGAATWGDVRSWSRDYVAESFPAESIDVLRIWDSRAFRDWSDTFGGSVGIGLGRVRNTTALYEARVFEERLLDAHALRHALGHDARQRLAELFAARSGVQTTHDRPAIGLWESIEQILHEDGALEPGASLPASAVFRATANYFADGYWYDGSGLPSSPVTRLSGFSAGWSLGGSTTRGHGRTQFARSRLITRAGVAEPWTEIRESYDSGRAPNHDLIDMGPFFEYGRAVSMRWQLDASGSSRFSTRKSSWHFGHDLRADFTGIVADRWSMSTSARYTRSVSRDRAKVQSTDYWNWLLDARATYYVTDHMNAYIDLSQSYTKRGPDLVSSSYYEAPATRHDSGGIIFFGLTYRFAGHASIAGVYPAGAQ